MSATIVVTQVGEGDPLAFEVLVREGGGASRHRVTLSAGDFARIGSGASADEVVEAAFRFLLDREPKESNLAHFDVSVISRYFPEFEERLPDYLS